MQARGDECLIGGDESLLDLVGVTRPLPLVDVAVDSITRRGLGLDSLALESVDDADVLRCREIIFGFLE